MSTTDTVIVARRRFEGYDDPAWPIGFWIGVVTATGDASGGTTFMRFQFNPVNQPLDSQLYSLEQIYVESDATTSSRGRIRTTGMEGPFNTLNYLNVMAIDIQADGQGTGAALFARDAAGLRGLFLGSQRLVGTASDLSIEVDNVNTIEYSAGAQGYVWGPRSPNQDGGIQRPITGLYPA